MKTRHLLLTLLLALAMPLALKAQVERTVTVYNGNATSTHIPLDGTHGVTMPALTQYIMDKAELGDIVGKPITKMAFHVVAPAPAMNSGNHFSYEVLLAEVDAASFTGNQMIQSSAMTNVEYVAANVSLNIVDNMLEISFSEAYTFSGNKNLLVQLDCSSGSQSYYSPWYSTAVRFYGVNVARAGNVDMGGIYRHFGFVPKTTFTYQDDANWANTNRPRNLSYTVDPDGAHITLNWEAPSGYSGSYQTLCVEHGTTPNWSNAETTSYTTDLFYGLTPNTTYDLYVRAKNNFFVSAIAKAIVNTANIADLDNGDLVIDFDGAYVPNGVVATSSDVTLETSRFFYIEGNGYGSYLLPSSSLTINLPKLHYTNATNGIIMEFDLINTDDLQVKFNKQGITTDIASYSNVGYGANGKHCSLRVVDGTGAQDAYFQLIGSFNIDNIVIRKAAEVMPVTNLAVSDVGTTEATITWEDPNTNTHNSYLYYRPKGYQNNNPSIWAFTLDVSNSTSYTITGLDPFTEYEVKVVAYNNNSPIESSEILSFATMSPATATPYSQYFTNLSNLPAYWRVAAGEGVEYSLNSNMLTVHNTSYESTSYGTTYTSYHTLDAYVILPYFENLASLQLSFKAGRTAGSYNELVVGVMSDPFDASTFRTLETRILNGPSTTYNFSLASSAWTNGHIAIKLNHYESNSQSVWFDDFVVTRYAAPTSLTVSNVTNTSATLGWTSTATEWEIRYGTDANNYSTPIAVTDNPTYTITGLTANTNYVAQVRAKYGENLYSEWVSFDSFKTLMQTAVVLNATNTSYNEDFESDTHGWILNNGASTNYWCHNRSAGVPYYNGTMYTYVDSNRSIYITDGTTTGGMIGSRPTWQYTKMNENQLQNIARPSLVYLTKIFNLSAGQYTFDFDYKVMGNVGEDYLRVFLLPADVELTGSNTSTFPSGSQDWYYLDNGSQVAQTTNNNSPTADFVSFGNGTDLHNVVEVRPGGDIEPGNYMLVFAWRNTGTTNALTNNPVQYPAAIDNVSVTWSSVISGPEFALVGTTDTEATLDLFAPGLGIAPTSYEVQYEPALDHNNYVDAPIASFAATSNPVSATLTGLTPHTLYNVRLRSVYTANGNSIYSDWVNANDCFMTLYPRPTDLAVVDQTTSWANVVWAPVEVNLAEGEYINYWWQLTTDPDDWGEYIGQGQISNSWAQNFVPGSYYFHVSTAVYQQNGNLFMGQSDWSEPIAFTIAPWTDPVTIFPLTHDFEEPADHFADGLTLDGDFEHLDITSHIAIGVAAPEGGENEYALQFHSCNNKTASLVLPPLRPSTNDALVSFWWYHDNNGTLNEGVVVEYSSNGSSWTSLGTMIPRYAETSGWLKYQQVVPAAGTNPTYIRLRFYGSNSNQWTNCCYLDDLTVNTFKSYQPYISYVAPGTNSVTITLYDYAYENGYYSSAFEVDYREYREPGEPEEEWVTYPIFNEEEPAFEHSLVVNGLQPTTLYEFRARARVSYGGFDFPWSNYCEPYRQWTDCGTYTITPTQSYTMDFEDVFYTNCWTADEGWTMQQSGGYDGSSYCAYISAGTYNRRLYTPTINFENCDNVIIRFWAKGQGRVEVHYGENFETTNSFGILPETNDWTMIELPLSSYMSNAPLKVVFRTLTNKEWYVDNISIIANAYAKIFDDGGRNMSFWTANHWYPSGLPTENDDVMIMGNAYTGNNCVARTIDFGVSLGKLVVYGTNKNLTAMTINASKENAVEIRAGSTLNVTTLNLGAANSVVVKDGGVLNATTITGTTGGAHDRVVIKDGGQVKTENAFYGTIEKDITGYGEGNAGDNSGYYLVATPTYVMVEHTFVPQNGSEYLYDQMDFYTFNGSSDLAWNNVKCSLPEGCEGPNGITPQGHVSAEMGLPKKGYLYARQEDGTVQMAAGPVGNIPFRATNVETEVSLSYNTTVTDAQFNGWNLIGNPYTCNAYLLDEVDNIMPFYRMNETGDTIVPAQAGTAIKPCEGVFVVCPNDEQPHSAVFTTTAPANTGEVQDVPMVTVPVHALLGNQEAYLILRQMEELAEGWNWWAPTVQCSVGDLGDDIETIISKDGKLTNGEDILAPGQMYKLQTYDDCTLNVLGIVVPNVSLSIESGYNWFGCTVETNINDLGITPATGDKIISQDQGFAIFNGTSWEGTLTTLEAGKGYVYIR